MPKRLILTGFIFAVALVVSVIGYTWDHWWYQVDELQESGSRWKVTVYKSTNGNILFYGTNDSLAYTRIYDPIQQRMGEPGNSKIYILPYIAFNKEAPLPVEWSENNNSLVVQGSRIDYTTYMGVRIRVDISNY